jgi:hypothetical protein
MDLKDYKPHRSNYQPLRDLHTDQLNQSDQKIAEDNRSVEVSAEPEPTRPEGHPAERSSGWTDRGDMVSQQASAMASIKSEHERRNSAREALDRHIEEKRSDNAVENAPSKRDLLQQYMNTSEQISRPHQEVERKLDIDRDI